MTKRTEAHGTIQIKTYEPTTYHGRSDPPALIETWIVVPGSGSSQLLGLRGEGGFEAQLGQNAGSTPAVGLND